MNKAQHTFYGVSYLLSLTALVVIGFAFSNILYFVIEDIFNLPVQFSFPLGTEYAVSVSTLLVMSVVFITCFALNGFIQRKEPREILESKWRRLFLRFMLFLTLIVFIIYVIGIFYDYFSGKGDLTQLLKTVVMLLVTSLVSFIFYFEAKPKIANSKVYRSFVYFSVLASSVTGAFLTIHFAPPSIMRDVHYDYHLLRSIDNAVIKIKAYSDSEKHLPKQLSDTESYGEGYYEIELDEKDLTRLHYSIKNENTFQICAEFKSDPNATYMRRLRYQVRKMHNAPGKNCRVYTIKKSSNNTTFAHLDMTKVVEKKEN